jgi:hypothetical protein
MAFNAHVLQVLIASPGDTREARDEVEKSLHGWNGSRAEREQIILLPRRWETDSVPRMGEGDGQEVINKELVDKADIVIVIFNSKVGQATARAISGTAEELDKAVDDGKQVHVYFSNAPVNRTDLESAAQLEAFRKSLELRGLYGSYSDAADLGFQVRQAIESDLDKLNLAAPTGRKTAVGADPVAAYDYDIEPHSDRNGKISHRRRNHRIRVVNSGEATANNFRFTLTALDGEELPMIRQHEIGPTIPRTGDYVWQLMPMGGSSQSVQMEMTWDEDGEERTKLQSLALI